MAIDAEADLGTTRGAYGLAARLNVSLPGLEREIAQAHWLESANLLNEVVRSTMIDSDFMQMLNEKWIRLFPDQFDELLASHLLVINLFPRTRPIALQFPDALARLGRTGDRFSPHEK